MGKLEESFIIGVNVMKDESDKTSDFEVPGVYEVEGDKFSVFVTDDGVVRAVDSEGKFVPSADITFEGGRISDLPFDFKIPKNYKET